MSSRGVYRIIIKDERGLSLLETLIGLFILLTVVFFFPSVFISLTNASPDVNEFAYEEYILFINQLQMEYKRSDNYFVNDRHNKLYLVKEDDLNNIVHFEQYQDKIRRQVNGVGHEVFMQQIKGFKVYERSYGLDVEVKMDQGKLTRSIIHPKKYKENYLSQ
ncbi:competence type IV pilus minor pilin ComGF [Salipaludibacillus daqingensis]|uniref:competence type IV pilus minor pilin ComGF n=1 Tax=Salipaludibacillus daqingensis TaxID=3041001 RepID=UPI002474C30E|nr:competence type IV pilus minor pilin ComGF [Salipaludibacillus daqingensis]